MPFRCHSPSLDDDGLYGAQKMAMLSAHGLKKGHSYTLSRNRVDGNLIFALRVDAMTLADLGKVDRAKAGNPVTITNELKALRTLAELCTTMEKRYPTRLEDDVKILQEDEAKKEGDPSSGLSPRIRDAIRHRHGEKWVLRDCVDVVRAQWHSLLTADKNPLDDDEEESLSLIHI